MKSIVDFEWGSVGRYQEWVRINLGLKDYSVSSVYSFRITGGNMDTLRQRKVKLLALLTENRRRLEVFVGENREGLGEHELAVMRSMYRQYSSCIDIVTGHISAVNELELYRASELFQLDGELSDDEIPF